MPTPDLAAAVPAVPAVTPALPGTAPTAAPRQMLPLPQGVEIFVVPRHRNYSPETRQAVALCLAPPTDAGSPGDAPVDVLYVNPDATGAAPELAWGRVGREVAFSKAAAEAIGEKNDELERRRQDYLWEDAFGRR